ncbi:hypothetical protein IY230_05290 [Acholeplasma laidlawii]|uniref:hypothetical protein n=1 Tax=Acholeplasma laidlawii TaxID=2148 RepID=UPI0018C1DF8C|nr:hypothetical protein [Acholeplasma laidlawii]MBG0763014.1 hypothetical protein [Acholeplasma laidlawii]
MKVLKEKGKLAIIGGDFRQINDAMFKGLYYAIFRGKKAISIMSKSTPKTLKKIKELVEDNKLHQFIGSIYLSAHIKDAYIDFKDAKVMGKIIIEMPK